ncbi:hypothetical protein [Modestobacter sp. NPDC049651]|uniref:hypothetical protein n=1 Tax=unclassified Modestobacter TaxID=2643866 RepID=UPI00340A2973
MTAGAGRGPDAGRDDRPDDERDGEGGDPACWLSRVCPGCGRIADEDPPTRCRACGAPVGAD